MQKPNDGQQGKSNDTTYGASPQVKPHLVFRIAKAFFKWVAWTSLVLTVVFVIATLGLVFAMHAGWVGVETLSITVDDTVITMPPSTGWGLLALLGAAVVLALVLGLVLAVLLPIVLLLLIVSLLMAAVSVFVSAIAGSVPLFALLFVVWLIWKLAFPHKKASV